MRIKSLDIYRGLTIISMVIVNSYGNEEHAYSFLKHAEWHGWKIADLIAPIFLFIMGISMSYSFKKRKNKNTLKKEQYKKIIKRSFTLFMLGIITYNFPFYNLSSIRIMGVLQRVSIVYLMASIIVLNLTKKQVYILITVILLGYYGIIATSLILNTGTNILSAENSITTILDRAILGQSHLWNGELYDPEGLTASIPASTLTLIGYLTGEWTQQQKESSNTAIKMLITGIIFIGVAKIWSFFLPINKTLWTSSYAILTTGFGLSLWGIFYLIIEVKKSKLFNGFKAPGQNAIIVFAGSTILEIILQVTPIQTASSHTSLKQWVYENILNSWLGNANASLAYGILNAVIWWGICYTLYKKQICFKV